MFGELVTKKLGKELTCVESERAKNNEDICVLCKCSPKGELSREGF